MPSHFSCMLILLSKSGFSENGEILYFGGWYTATVGFKVTKTLSMHAPQWSYSVIQHSILWCFLSSAPLQRASFWMFAIALRSRMNFSGIFAETKVDLKQVTIRRSTSSWWQTELVRQKYPVGKKQWGPMQRGSTETLERADRMTRKRRNRTQLRQSVLYMPCIFRKWWPLLQWAKCR